VVFANVTEKSDFNIAGGLNVGQVTSGGHLHANVAISPKFYLSGSFTSYSGGCSESSTFNGVTTNNTTKYSGKSFLFGFGYYKSLGKHFYFENALGAKYGNNANVRAYENFEYRHIKYFLQPGISYTRKHFQTGIALRLGLIDYLNHATGSQNTIPKIATEGVSPYVDPAFFICAGGKFIKIGSQISATFSDYSNITFIPVGSAFSMVSYDALSFSLFLRITIPSKITEK